ncbi:MAG: hypothetical protein COC00_001085 [Rhizobiales bacterium]|nr:hypothetical protein [Hyphomicrobiales bacterium]
MSYESYSELDFVGAVKSMNTIAHISLIQTSINTSKTTKTITKTKKV